MSEEINMLALEGLQNDIKNRTNKTRVNFKKSAKDRITKCYIEARLGTLEEQWKAFIDTHRSIITEIDAKEYQTSNYFKNDEYEAVEELYCIYKSELEEALSKICKKKDDSESQRVNLSSNVKLPRITIPMFSGQYSEWTTFKDLFTSLVHKNSNLDNVQKLHYLKAHLSGEAEQLLRHVPVSDDNYKESWDLLYKRYSNKRYLSNCLLKRLLSQPSVVNESSKAIKDLLDTTTDCLNGLANLKIKTDTWDTIVIYIISNKLDPESRKLWESEISKNEADELPTMTQFRNFMEHRFRSLEFMCPKAVKPNLVRNPSNLVSTKVHHAQAITSACEYCHDGHKLYNCKKFSMQDCETRRKFVQSNRLCFNCMGTNHTVYTCRQTSRCRICRKKHHSLLHPQIVQKPNSNDVKDPSGDQVVVANSTLNLNVEKDEPSSVVTCFSKTYSHVLLATALVRVESKLGNHLTLRSLIDQGCQASFITESAVQALGLQKVPSKVLISGVGGNRSDNIASNFMVELKLKSRYNSNYIVVVKAYVLSKLTSLLPAKEVKVQVWSELVNLQLADPKFNIPNKVDLLLGAEVFGQILVEGLIRGSSGSLVAQNTRLGWILSGQIHEESLDSSGMCNHRSVTSLHAVVDENDLLRKFWELETEPTVAGKKILTEEEQKCEEFYAKTTTRDTNGRYIVKLPFRTPDPQCKDGKSQAIAVRRLQYLEKRLSRNPELKVQYSNVLSDYLTLGHMELVPDNQRGKPDAVYLPHHAVVREDKTTSKVRIVFNASSPGVNGVSLNNDLMVGPTLQNDLRHIIMRWRQHPIALIADIVKMYRQIKVCDEDTDFQRIVWSDKSGIQDYRLLRVTFGTACAPYLAVKTLHQLALDEGKDCPCAAERVQKDFYMDDLMTGCQTLREGLQLYKEMNELMQRGGFEMQKWKSSNKELFNKEREDSNKAGEKLEIGMEKEGSVLTKVLGLTWNNSTDEFEYTVQLPPMSTPVTKRSVISDISRLFDPLGWIAPTIITAKIFIQKLWMAGLEWDQQLPEHLLKEWTTYRNNLSQLTKFSIARWMHTSRDDVLVELHGFSDASDDAYAAVVYVRVLDSNGDVHVNLVTSKTKVSPIKRVSIPRLELCGAVLVAILLCEVAETLNIGKDKIHAWTDSCVVLAWLSSHPSRWKTFIANRVSQILTLFDRKQWSHVKSEENPADCASRGVQPSKELDLQLWTNGPAWLKNKIINYNPQTSINQDTSLEERAAKKVFLASVNVEDDEFCSRFSSLRRMLRVISYCRRFVKIAYAKSKNLAPPIFPKWLTSSELLAAETILITNTQKREFADELTCLSKNHHINKKSKLHSLSPLLDPSGILRVGGRLHKSQLSQARKHPILLPQKSHLTCLIVADAHTQTLHGGPQLTLNYIRTKYWVINARRAIRSCIHKCVTCVRYSARTSNLLMGQLPSARVTPSRPFLQSGVDYAGPIAIRTTKGRGHHSSKGYICVFICMATRVIHLEAVSDLTSEGFLAAFKRFIARRGHCSDLWSDNGTNFVGAARDLKTLLAAERSSVIAEIADSLATNGTEWHFIPPHAPNFGGLWEAGVRSTKHHLKRVIGNSTLTFEEISTVLAQIEACLNSRPIAQVGDNLNDPYPLTPGHFLVGEALLLPLSENYECSNVGSLKRWQHTQKMVQDFWRRWSQEYLAQFLQRHKWTRQVPEPKIGDLVLIKEDDLPPARWLFGIVTKKHPGSDQITRVVTLRCKETIIKWPVSKLCILPVSE